MSNKVALYEALVGLQILPDQEGYRSTTTQSLRNSVVAETIAKSEKGEGSDVGPVAPRAGCNSHLRD